ncbi:hypothetical protein, conserved [Thermococcus kodakarensis KOD1]|uniref:Uncharacterized protein n=1 Tax=Thermococcus kodakarensis (strain ATCC BAA-918 / JCM 12380 / KOD1) TaxID=69014 RepID=Q5JGV7_THEKO|nr:hypothetical protein [Thermococcus kodakarensis]WCN27328.1 hypothetical protein POG15_06855 [Thermococcus kodakarensis]WCN29617.1 hypothetical protein POG21_06850 [Thermococcus kodakarensis]BAD85538.1 hypothetical protein, conserved [Thermococcus kodakarensis KOD1]
MTAKYKYLGRRVKDRGQKGLDSAREFYDIIKAILRDYKAGRITGKTARGRLLLLYRLSFKKNNSKIRHLSNSTLQRIRRRIKKAMEEVKG